MKKDKHCILTIFGATGDLTNRKLLPALYFLEKEAQLKENFRIICVARRQKSSEGYRKDATEAIKRFSRIKVDESVLSRLASRIYYFRLEFSNKIGYAGLRKFMEGVSGDKCSRCERIFYLAVPPEFFDDIVNNLKKFKLAERQNSTKAYARVMFEKPFGSNLNSAKKLNSSITRVFNENQIYRIEHYMAKELVQNLLVLRFANSIFEPLWNKEYIDHVQITVAESIGIEGRGEYYDNSGALRDIMQNHMMQLLTLVAMEEPKSFDVEEIRNKKVKVLKSIQKFTKSQVADILVRGQYKGYTEEPEVRKGSTTETYIALKLAISNKMWRGVPFYLRTGKRLKERATEIVIVYKKVPFDLFSKLAPHSNMMIIRVQPYEGITLQFNAKVPGSKMLIDDVNMDFCHECKFGPNTPQSYERLLYDAMLGDQTLFTRWDEVENSWKIIDALEEGIKHTKLFKYEAGTWGPAEADKLIGKDNRKWIEPKKPSYAEQLEKMYTDQLR